MGYLCIYSLPPFLTSNLSARSHRSSPQEMVERFQSEKSQDQHRYQELATQQSQSSAVFQKQLEEVEVKHQNHLSELESQFQQKIMNELERYTALQVDKEALNDKWDEQNSMLMDSHERVIQARPQRLVFGFVFPLH